MKKRLDHIIVRDMRADEAGQVSRFIAKVFDEFVAPDLLPGGAEEFMKYASPQAMAERVENRNLCLLAEKGGDVLAVLCIRRQSHVSLFFVEPELHGQGLGKRMLNTAMARLKQARPDLGRITVNSSLFAEKVYERLGFEKTDEEQCKGGIRYIPMCKELGF
jgi:GNAT superfamily N-acetyltransferase